jgi:hypothetical protein
VAEVEHNSDVWSINLLGDSNGLLDPLDPAADVRVQQQLRPGIAGL